MARYSKFLVALAAAVLAILDHYMGPNNPIDAIIIALVSALGVYAVPNAVTVIRRTDTQ